MNRTDAATSPKTLVEAFPHALSSSSLVPQETSAGIQNVLFGSAPQPQKLHISRTRAEITQSRRDFNAEKAQRAAFLDSKTFAQPTALETAFRHSGWRYRRARVINALVRTNAPEFRRQQFERCGSCCSIKRKIGSDEARIVGNYCHDRWCLPCQRSRARILAASVLALMNPDRPHRFIALTLPHTSEPLKVRVKLLYDSFKRLREMPAWKEANEGGVSFLEVKIGRDGQWHPHLHLITVGKYFPAQTLWNCWQSAVGTRARVDIKFIEPMHTRPASRIAVTKYLTTYAASPIDDNVIEDEDKLDEALTALKGCRCSNAFGTWRGKSLIDKEPIDGEWEHVCTIDQLLTATHNAEPWAIALMKNVAPSRLIECLPPEHDPP